MKLCCVSLVIYLQSTLLKGAVGENCKCEYNTGIQKLTVSCNTNATSIDYEQCFAKYNHAKALSFQDSGLTAIPTNLDIFLNLASIDLSHNRISSVNFDNGTRSCRNLKTFRMDANEIRVLKAGCFDCLTNVRKVYIRNNSMTIIENGTFNEAHQNLTSLDVSNNNLTSMDTSWFFRRRINDSKIFGDVVADHNQINVVTNFGDMNVMDVNPDLAFRLSLLHNNFTGVNGTFYYEMLNITNSVQIYRFWNCGVDLRYNPFVCDCNIHTFAKLLRMFRTMDPDNPTFSVTCFQPVSLRGVLLYEVEERDFNCSVRERCPVGCTCILSIALNMTTISCDEDYHVSELPEHLPLSEKIVLIISSRYLSRLSPRPYLANVTLLDLSNSGLTHIDAGVLPQLENISDVFLHDNSLKYLPIEITRLNFTNLRKLTIHNNPFMCDCHTVWLKTWIEDENVASYITDQNKIMCGDGVPKGKAMLTVPDSLFKCVVTLTITEIVIIIVVCIVIFVLAIILVLRHRNRFFLLAAIDRATFHETRRSYLYDVYISYSSLDNAVVQDLIAELECHQPPFKVCIDSRDFTAGLKITDNIKNAVKNSRSTLVLLSNNFLESKWCLHEFWIAEHHHKGRDGGGLIVALLEDLKETSVVPVVTDFLQTHGCLRIADNHFFPSLVGRLKTRRQISRETLSEKTPLL